MTDPIASPMAPVRIGALRAAGGVTAALLAVVLVTSAADMVLTPTSVEGRNTQIASAEMVVSLIRVVAMVGAAAAIMAWLYIAAENAQAWGIRLKWGPGWAIGAWFLPLANLVIPVLVVNGLARASASPVSPWSAPGRAGTGLVAAWWATFLLGVGFTRASARKAFTPDGDYVLGYVAPGTVCYIAAAVFGMLLIRHITALQVNRQAALDALRPGSA